MTRWDFRGILEDVVDRDESSWDSSCCTWDASRSARGCSCDLRSFSRISDLFPPISPSFPSLKYNRQQSLQPKAHGMAHVPKPKALVSQAHLRSTSFQTSFSFSSSMLQDKARNCSITRERIPVVANAVAVAMTVEDNTI